ncbi:hypothetical protein A0128_13075 [Leptospira tipperaryensis]|uniref:Uncharacterized protein n=1 Tax=Leptospira tipperaryensis TaxID=2564040 RepID=A0A1D7UYQ4_9LEPT|nr:hypothetical protein A0128_13075 [Leptospira tipperaryensis]
MIRKKDPVEILRLKSLSKFNLSNFFFRIRYPFSFIISDSFYNLTLIPGYSTLAGSIFGTPFQRTDDF